MGDSKPPKAQFDLIGSYARRRGANVELVFVDPSDEISGLSEVVLRRAGRDVVVPLEHTEGRTVGRAARSQFSDGIWTIGRAASGGDDQRLNARLLVQGERPLVLLWGGETKPSTVPKAVRHMPARNRAAAHTSGALDAVLNRLPVEPANKIRSAVRTRARRALG